MKQNQEDMECWVDAAHASETRQLQLIQTQLDQSWDMSSPMQDVPCIGHLKCKLK
jgi:hypothetical protein